MHSDVIHFVDQVWNQNFSDLADRIGSTYARCDYLGGEGLHLKKDEEWIAEYWAESSDWDHDALEYFAIFYEGNQER